MRYAESKNKEIWIMDLRTLEIEKVRTLEIISVIRIVSSVAIGSGLYYSFSGNKETRRTARVATFISLVLVLICLSIEVGGRR